LGAYRREPSASTIPTVRESFFTVSLAAFAAIGLPVTFCSSLGGLIRTLQRASTERVSEAINLGTSLGLLPGILLAAVVFVTGIGT
jgi:hypothetical protein